MKRRMGLYRSVAWLAFAATVAVVATGVASTVDPVAASSPPQQRAGSVVIVGAIDQSRELTHGTASTAFSVRLPDGAACPGDSANDQWRVQSFMLPAGDDPTAVKYGPIGPDPSGNGRYALFDVDTTPFVHRLTLKNVTAGSPGIIPAMPALSLSVVAGERIPSGNYRIGVSCTRFGTTARFWDAEIAVSDDDKGLTWRLSGLPPSVNQHSNSSSGVLTALLFGGIAAAFGGWLLWRRTSPKTRNNLAKGTS